jgi:hypothetical protein
MAGIASAQAGVIATNVRALITGTGELTSYETCATLKKELIHRRSPPASSRTDE